VGNILTTKQVLETQIAQATPESTLYVWAYPFNESPTPINTASTPGVTQQPINSSQIPWSNKLIGIVAGHSGNDSGAVCSDALGGYREVDINQNVANLVKDNLVAAGYDVDLLSEFDTRLTGYQSLALISIHSDSCEYINDQATGFKVSTAGLNANPEKSARLTTCLQTKYAEITKLKFHPGAVTSDMTLYHPFTEIDSNTTAAVIEIGYINMDNKILTEQPELIARGISEGILCYVNNENISP
jgi:N-acetylmuramoyl-L-alanine amidase